MIYSIICTISVGNIAVLALITSIFVKNPPGWLTRSNYQILYHIQYLVFLSVFWIFLAVYEAQESNISRNSIIFKEIPKSLSLITLIISALCLFLHYEKYKSEKTEKLDELIKRFLVFITVLLDFFCFYLGGFFGFFASLPLLVLPCETKKQNYLEGHLNTNEKKYWVNNIIVQAILAFRHVVFSNFSEYVKWYLFDVLQIVFNKRVVWDVMFLCMDLETGYVFGNDWLVGEVFGYFFVIFIAIQTFWGGLLLKKHLFPVTIFVMIFFASSSLRIFALVVGIKLAFAIEFNL